jgi:hypothetical protein
LCCSITSLHWPRQWPSAVGALAAQVS